MENISGFFVVFKEVEQWQITINIARREQYKIFTTKNIFKGENSYKNHIKNISIFVRLATAKPVFFQRTQAPLQGRTEPNAKRFGIVSYTYRFLIGMRTIQKDKGSRKKTKDFCGKRSRNGEYLQLRKRLTKSKVCGDTVSYTFWEKTAKRVHGGDELRRI